MQVSALPLPVQGFVLSGGKSSRMGRDKAILHLHGQSLVEIAVGKLRSFCSQVVICGNRKDLEFVAEVVPEARLDAGPAAGIESGLLVSTQPWALFMPVDVPLIPVHILQSWAEVILQRDSEGVRLSCLRAGGVLQPAFCLLHRDCSPIWTQAVSGGEHKLSVLFARVANNMGPATMAFLDVEDLTSNNETTAAESTTWFSNVNTPEDWSALQLLHVGHRIDDLVS